MADRVIVYDGAIPRSADVLLAQKNGMIGLGWLIEAMLGSGTFIDGLKCDPGAGLTVVIQPGQIFSSLSTDASDYSSVSADAHPLMKQGLLLDSVTLNCPAPATAGQTIGYLVQAKILEYDDDPLQLGYFNSADPDTPLSGPEGSGVAQNTLRKCVCQIAIKAGAAASGSSWTYPNADSGYESLWQIAVTNGQSTIISGNIMRHPNSPLNVARTLLEKIKTVDGTGSELNADLLQGLPASAYAKAHRGALVYNVTTSSDTPTSSGAVNFDSRVYDTDNIHTLGTSTKLTVPAGVQLVRLTAKIEINADTAFGYFQAWIAKNGVMNVPGIPEASTYCTNNQSGTSINLSSAVISAVPGDYFEVFVLTPGGNVANSLVGTKCWFSMEIQK